MNELIELLETTVERFKSLHNNTDEVGEEEACDIIDSVLMEMDDHLVNCKEWVPILKRCNDANN